MPRSAMALLLLLAHAASAQDDENAELTFLFTDPSEAPLMTVPDADRLDISNFTLLGRLSACTVHGTDSRCVAGEGYHGSAYLDRTRQVPSAARACKKPPCETMFAVVADRVQSDQQSS